jgi:HTH-type transcriptional regulator/antitoxin HigA
MIATVDNKYSIKGIHTMPEPVRSDAQNDHYTEVLFQLEKRGKLSSAEKQFAEVLTLLIEAYEDEHYPIDEASPIEVIQTLMDANNLRQKDLVGIFGTESMVSMILSGQRSLSAEHIAGLSRRFHVSPEVFFALKEMSA